MNPGDRVRDFYEIINRAFSINLDFSKARRPLEVAFIFRKVQGELDRKGDDFVKMAANIMITMGNLGQLRNGKRAEIINLMNSNYFLERTYHKLGFPNLSTFFDQEKNHRNFKVHASMMEFIIGLILEIEGPELTMSILEKIIYSEIIYSSEPLQIDELLKAMREYTKSAKLPFK